MYNSCNIIKKMTPKYSKCKYRDFYSFKGEGRRVRRIAKDSKKKKKSTKQ